ncbi:MAG: hypothetical protein K5777_05530 [Nitrosopumilus sp.]|nr:hypothetical protein [Nitrosopumilus sp.]
MINYKEPTVENRSYDKSLHCDYCGILLNAQNDYCSDLCKQKDSVWHRDIDV